MPSRSQQLRLVDPIYTGIARGYSNNEFIANILFPEVFVDERRGKVPTWGKEAFQVHKTKRAPRAASNRLTHDSMTLADYSLEEHDLEQALDHNEIAEAEKAGYDLKERATNTTTEGLQLMREKNAADYAQSTGNYASTNKVTLSSGDRFTNSAADVLGIFDDSKEALEDQIGRVPNTLVLAANAWNAIRRHPSLIDKVKYSATGLITMERFKELVEIENIVVGRGLYSNDLQSFNRIWYNNAILAYVPQSTGEQRSMYDPNYGYTLVLSGYPETDTYEETQTKSEVVRTTLIYQVKVLGPDSAYLINGTNS